MTRDMDLHVMAKAYDSYGGHTTLSPIGGFLVRDAPEVGSGIAEITVVLHFPHSGPPKKTLESLLERHTEYRATLPTITYYRSRKRVEIDIASEIEGRQDLRPSPRLSLPLFEQGVGEVIQALTLIRKRVKKSDPFDCDAFLAHCEAARERIPDSEDALQDLVAELDTAARAKRDAMSPWEQLDIDWSEFHPKAKALLDDPFFWTCTDDFSPNGNDTGSDVLDTYRNWLEQNEDGQPSRFLEDLAKRWGYECSSEMDEETRNEAAIGLAFADLKLRGVCAEDVRRSALATVEIQREEAEAASDWPHRGERLTALEKIEEMLKRAGDGSG